LPGYNAPGIAGYLNFTPETLAGIYLGTITKWNDPEISKANTQVSLPDHQIVVVHRQDGSGTTYIWTDYLSKVSSDWRQRVGTNISVAWPVGIAAEGNEGVAQAVVNTPYSIGYSELTYAVRSRLMYGSVANRSGRFVRADFASVTAAAASAAGGIPADFRVSITDPPGADVYPISSFTWILLPSVISDQAKSAALVKFVEWGLADGQDYLESLAYARLPQELIVREQTGLGRINTSNQANAGDSPSVSVRASQ
jgi:phosphate transport system substrate-binding protein